MADNYLESHYEEYLKRKAEWERRGKPKPKPKTEQQHIIK